MDHEVGWTRLDFIQYELSKVPLFDKNCDFCLGWVIDWTIIKLCIKNGGHGK